MSVCVFKFDQFDQTNNGRKFQIFIKYCKKT